MQRQAINDAPSVAQDFYFFFLSIFWPCVVVLVDKQPKLCTKRFFFCVFFFFCAPLSPQPFNPRGGLIGGGVLKLS